MTEIHRIPFKDRSGCKIHYLSENCPTKRWDIKVRTEDKRLTFWMGGGKNLLLSEAVELWDKIRTMESKYEPVAIIEF